MKATLRTTESMIITPSSLQRLDDNPAQYVKAKSSRGGAVNIYTNPAILLAQ